MKNIKPIYLLLFLSIMSSNSFAQKKKKNQETPAPSTAVKTDAKPENKKPKTIKEVVGKEAKSMNGIFTVYSDKGKLFFEIPKSVLEKEFLVVSRVAETPGIEYGGTEFNTQTVRWQMNYDKVLLRSVSYENVATDSLPIAKAVQHSNFEPIIKTFTIEAYNDDSSNVLIDATSLFLEDTYPFNFPSEMRTAYQIKALDKTRTFLEYAKAFPTNVEVRALLTYNAGKPTQQSEVQSLSMMIHHSMILLPEQKMMPRYNDQRIGYFGIRQQEFGEEHQVNQKAYIVKWRLEPKPEDIEKFKRGELVEPIKPITYYIDPATPVKWVGALKEGVEDWNVAFEAAGFKNAIRCIDAPTDEDWSPEDARYSVIRYFASPILNAYGPNVHDPRTGEILESDIGWYYNVLKLLRNWYFVQASAVDLRAETLPIPDSLMYQLVRFVSSHEVGHTLGLQHNMKASHFYPVDSLRSASFTAKYGTAPSIMDYARFNYVAQPGDNAAMFPKIGQYDKFAIEWGYKPIFEAKTSDEELPVLDKWLQRQEKDSLIRFGQQQFRISDPYAQTEDLGDDAIKATTYGLMNLERISKNLIKATTSTRGKDYLLLGEMYIELLNQWNREMGHVANYVGAVEKVNKVTGDKGLVYTMIPAAKQKEAIKFVAKNGFTVPESFLDPEILRRIETAGSTQRIMQYQSRLLYTMFSDDKLLRINDNEVINPKGAYKLTDVYADLKNAVWSDISKAAVTVNPYYRSLQSEYIKILELKTKTPASKDIEAMSWMQIKDLKREIDLATTRSTDVITKAHLQNLSVALDKLINIK